MTIVPAQNRLAIAERKGKIYTFVNDPKTSKSDLLIDMKKTVYGLAFHPQFAKSRYVYLTYVLDPEKTQPKGSRLSRFDVKAGDTLTADPASEKVILEWPSGGHNGGCIRFGPDGFLY